MQDKLGDYMKGFESTEASRRAVKGMPLIARLDGRAFHTFTRGLDRPFDSSLTKLMQDTTKFLVEETNALVGYTQSDEITLIWYLPEKSESQYLFDGRYQKLSSILAALATGYFNKHLSDVLPSKANALPLFDARVWQVPTLNDAYLALLWREKDAIKNSITMVALSHFSHKSLQNVNGQVKRQMLKDVGDPWEAYASCYRKGSYFMRVAEERELTSEELSKIPEKHRPVGPVVRQTVKYIALPDLMDLQSEPEEKRLSVVFPTLNQ